MKLHSQIHSRMWLGGTMSEIARERDAEAFKLAIYLITSPHSHMSELYYCPICEIATHTGVTVDQVEQYLAELEDEGFCKYDATVQIVWVIRMCRWQIGETLNPKDNRVIGAIKHAKALPSSSLVNEFLSYYGFNEGASEGTPSPPCPLPSFSVGLEAAGVRKLTMVNASTKTEMGP